MEIIEKIKTLTCCPNCGGKGGYFSKVRTKGEWNDNVGWDGKKENTEMMDSFVDTWESTFYFCQDCKKPICRRDSKIEKL